MASEWDQFPLVQPAAPSPDMAPSASQLVAPPAGQSMAPSLALPQPSVAGWEQFPLVNTPPPGVMIHDTNRSYIVGPDGQPAQSVNTAGMDQNQLDAAHAGLRMRQLGYGVPAWLQPFIQGATLGFGDEIGATGAGLASLLKEGSFSKGYDAVREAQRQDLAQQRADHPIASTATQIAGGAALAPFVAPLMATGGALAPAAQVALGAGGGAVLGGVEGFGSGSGLEDRLKQAGSGAALGGVIGAAAPLVAKGVGAVTQKALDRFTVNPQLRALGVDRPAADAVTRVLAADNAFGGAGAQNIAAAGPEGMLADVGPSTRGMLDTAMQRGGPATLIAKQATEGRGVQANRTLQAALDSTLGKPEGVTATATNLRQGTAAVRQAAYDAAYAAPIDYSHPRALDLQDLLTRVPGDAIAKANRLMQLEGQQSNQIMASIGPDGSATLTQLPDVRQIDYITRGLRQLAESGEDAGKLGGRTDFSLAYQNLARNIRGAARDLVPEYGTALNTAADPISRKQALDFGATMLRPGVGRDEVAQAVDGMSKPEIDALKQGARSYIDDLMANVRSIASNPSADSQDAREAIAALRQLNSRAVRDKLTTVLPQNQAGFLMRQIDRAAKSAELYANVATNSRTFGRTATDQAVDQALAPGVVGDLARGEPLNAAKRATQFAFGTTPQDDLAAKDEIYRQIASLLTQRQGQDAQAAMQSLTNAYQAAPYNEALARILGANLGTGFGLGGYQAIPPLSGGRR